MLKALIVLALSMVFMATSCEDDLTNACIDAKIETFKEDNAERGSTGVYSFEQGGETYTIFDHGIAFDATAEVLNSACEVVCTYGGFRLAGDQDERCAQYQDGINNAVTEWEGGR